MKTLGLTISGLAIVAMVAAGIAVTQSSGSADVQLLAAADLGNFVGMRGSCCRPSDYNGDNCSDPNKCIELPESDPNYNPYYSMIWDDYPFVAKDCINGTPDNCYNTAVVVCGNSSYPGWAYFYENQECNGQPVRLETGEYEIPTAFGSLCE